MHICLSFRGCSKATASSIISGYGWQRDALTFMTVAVILFSLIYYASVFASEIVGYTPACVKKYFASRQRGHDVHLSHLIQNSQGDPEKARGDEEVMEMQAIQYNITAAEEERARASALQKELDDAKRFASKLVDNARSNKKGWSNPLKKKGRGKKMTGGKKALRNKNELQGACRK